MRILFRQKRTLYLASLDLSNDCVAAIEAVRFSRVASVGALFYFIEWEYHYEQIGLY